MLAVHTTGDGMANYSNILKGISDAPEYILRSQLSVHTYCLYIHMSFPIFLKKVLNKQEIKKL